MTSGLFNLAGRGSIAQSVPKKSPLRKDDRHRDVALKAVHARRMMVAEMFILRDVIDDNRSAAVTNFVADGGLNVEFPAWREPEGDLVANSTGNPTVFGNSRDGGESHPGCATDDFQNGRHRVDPGNRRDVGRQGGIKP